MNRDEQEMALWRRVYEHWFPRHGYEPEECSGIADAAVAEFRRRYPPQPTAPNAVWYDEPPFPKDGGVHYCWVADCSVPQSVYWSTSPRGWCYFSGANTPIHLLNGRRVCPVTKPPKPTP